MNIIDKFRKNEYVSFPMYSLTRKTAYHKYYNFFEKSQKWSRDEILDWQWKQVKQLVNYAFEYVPFYRSLYSNAGFEIGDLNTWDDFKYLPIISKEDIKENFEKCISNEHQTLRARIDYTGGSTGQPMKFYVDEKMYYREEAIYSWIWSKVRFKVGDKCVILRGKDVADINNKRVHEYNRFWNYLYLDSNYIAPKYIEYYDLILKKFQAKNIQAYPSSLDLLARAYLSTGREAPRFDNVFLGSENIYQDQVDMIKQVFGVKNVFNQYGHSEKILLGFQMVEENVMGFVPQYGYFELLDTSNKASVRAANALGEIVGTGFSKTMPFIRYRTSDCAYSTEKRLTGFMKNWDSIGKIEGRLHEFIITEDNRKVSICTIGGSHISELNRVLDMQYEQLENRMVLINVVENPNDKLRNVDINSIETKFKDVLNGKIKCKVIRVNQIEHTSRNKKSMLIQHINS